MCLISALIYQGSWRMPHRTCSGPDWPRRPRWMRAPGCLRAATPGRRPWAAAGWTARGQSRQRPPAPPVSPPGRWVGKALVAAPAKDRRLVRDQQLANLNKAAANPIRTKQTVVQELLWSIWCALWPGADAFLSQLQPQSLLMRFATEVSSRAQPALACAAPAAREAGRWAAACQTCRAGSQWPR